MADPDLTGTTLDDVTNKSFRTRFRGLDATEVARHLEDVAGTVRSLREELEANRTTIAELRERVDELELTAGPPRSLIDELDLDDPALKDRLDDEITRSVDTARAAAAEERAQADADAADIRAQAEQIYAERSQIADDETARIRAEMNTLREERLSEIDKEAAASRQKAEADVAALVERADAERADAEAESTRLVHEAQIVRRQILEDLARRRTSARRQIEQLRAGRDRLLASHDVVRTALAEVTEELRSSMTDARAAAESAGGAVAESTIEELEAEIETARLSGLLDTGPLPVVETTVKPAQRKPAGTTPTAVEPEPASDPKKETLPSEPANDPVDQTAPSEPANDPEDSGKAPSSDETEPALAAVVDLDAARHDVDTASHPASRRKEGEPERAAGSTTGAARLESVSDDSVDFEDEDLDVGALFARMRDDREQPAESAQTASKKKVPAKKSTSSPKKSAGSPAKRSTKKSEPVDLASVVSDMSRQLKRVLADEQSSVLSRLRGAKKMPTPDELLGDEPTHQDRYWDVARAGALDAVAEVKKQHSGSSDVAVDELRDEINKMVASLRTRVAKSVDNASDADSAVDELRKVYRDVKTKRIGQHAEALCDAVADAAARDNATPE